MSNVDSRAESIDKKTARLDAELRKYKVSNMHRVQKVKLALSYFTVRHRQKAVFHCYLNIERCINLFFSFSDNTKMVYCNDLSFSVKILTSTGKIKNILSKKCRITVLFLIIKSEVQHTIFFIFFLLKFELFGKHFLFREKSSNLVGTGTDPA